MSSRIVEANFAHFTNTHAVQLNGLTKSGSRVALL